MERLEQVAADHQEGTHDLIDGAIVAMVPVEQEMRRDEADPVERQGAAEHAEGGGGAGAGALGIAVAVDQARAEDTGLRI